MPWNPPRKEVSPLFKCKLCNKRLSRKNKYEMCAKCKNQTYTRMKCIKCGIRIGRMGYRNTKLCAHCTRVINGMLKKDLNKGSTILNIESK